MKLRSNLCLPFAATLAVIWGASAPTVAEEVLIDSIAAVVDEDVVMASELDERVREIYMRLKDSNTQIPPGDVLVPQVLERLILERIQLSRGQRAGVRISDDEVNQSIAQLAQSRGMTVDQMVEHAHQSGISLNRLREQVRTEMIIKRVQEGLVNRRINISEQEIDNFLKSEEGQQWSSPDLNLGHIILPLSAGAPRDEVAMVENKARELFEQLQAGADFRSLAIANSAGQNALQGGDLGWRKQAEIPSLFTSVVLTMQPGG